MQTPAADGLFQKGIIQSGVVEDFFDGEGDGREVVTAMMEELGVEDVEELETVPYAQLAAAYLKVSPAIAAKNIPADFWGKEKPYFAMKPPFLCKIVLAKPHSL